MVNQENERGNTALFAGMNLLKLKIETSVTVTCQKYITNQYDFNEASTDVNRNP